MLALTRKLGETVQIGPDIYVTVVRIERGQVRLGIAAPRDISIRRLELKLEEQNETDKDNPLLGGR